MWIAYTPISKSISRSISIASSVSCMCQTVGSIVSISFRLPLGHMDDRCGRSCKCVQRMSSWIQTKSAIAPSRKCETSIRTSMREARERIASPVAKAGEGIAVAKDGVAKQLRIGLCLGC